ncbi:MarR family winged helix-turn-helix transcriptional regulator [Streptomyces sp. NPDC050400]|uniref:MarR family winged helix-turn-helix transcriptional regulator n=1 Tax=Streptomyces sp. NPDC050400 TaxID=3365610 RepID=UPI00379AB190
MTTTAPRLNGQIIGQAFYATRALLDRRLTHEGVTFNQSLVLNVLAQHGGSWGRQALVERMTGTTKVTAEVAHAAFAELVAAGLVETGPGDRPDLLLTKTGRALQERLAEAVAGIAERVYANIPDDELAAAAQVLIRLTEQANAALAADEAAA